MDKDGQGPPPPYQNRLLQLADTSDRLLLEPHLEYLNMKQGDVCIEQMAPLDHVYFPGTCLSSTIMPDEENGTSEIGMQGYEGLIGIPAILGADQSPHKVFLQVGGPLWRIRTAQLRQAMDQSASLRNMLLKYAHVFLIQTGQTAHVNARFKLEERLARWLLMCADRVGPQLSLTHDYLAYMLGVRRSGVTNGIHILEGDGLITSTRGLLVIRNRAGLEVLAGRSYGIPEAEYARVIGPLR
jgi:CRP-like cAMP-binding protein